jgi:hypothetical protein
LENLYSYGKMFSEVCSVDPFAILIPDETQVVRTLICNDL